MIDISSSLLSESPLAINQLKRLHRGLRYAAVSREKAHSHKKEDRNDK
jgi:hypothetical protein